jgi:integrase
VFGDRIGRKVCDPKKSWQKACAAAEIEDLHFHDLRHEAGSRMLEQGWPLHHVQEMLGHADVKTTSVYLNLTRQGLQESMKRFGMPTLPDVAQVPVPEPPPSCNDDRGATDNRLVN